MRQGTVSPALPSLPTPNRSQLLHETQSRMFLEKHASEMVHLELSVLVEEINMISRFLDSSKLKKSVGMASGTEDSKMASEWQNLLKEMASYHQHAEQKLSQQHWEEIKGAGLSPEVLTLHDGVLFSLEEILQSLSSLGADLQKADSPFGTDIIQQAREAQPLWAGLDGGSAVQKMQAAAVKIVNQESVKQMRIHRVLDAYSHLQRCICPENVSQTLDNLRYRVAGETVARDVAQVSEKQQVERALAFVQEHHMEGGFLVQLKEGNEVEVRQLRTLIQRELQAQIEEKLQAKEAEAIQEAEKQMPAPSAAHVVYFLLSQRHLRQTVLILDGGLRLQETDASPVDEDSHMGDLSVEGSLVEDDLKAALQMLMAKGGYERPLLELKQTVQMLRLREKQFQEAAQAMKELSSDKHLDNAEQITQELQEFRQQKTKELKEQLGILLLEGQGAGESSLASPSPLQIKSPQLEKEDKERVGKEKPAVCQEMRLEELEESYRGQVSAECAKLQDQLERGEIKRDTMQTLIREHDETVTFLDKTFHQDVSKLRGKVKKEKKKKKDTRQEDQNALPSKAASSQPQSQPDQSEDRVLLLLAENIKIFRQTELLLTSRIALLNPQIRPFLTDADEFGGLKSSQLLALLKDMNIQIQRCAVAAGLLDPQCPENDAVNSFQDVMNIQMVPGSGDLLPLDPTDLSAKEFVIYQYGIVILQFLRPLVGAPEIELCIASSIPSSDAPGNAFRNSFYYQPPGHVLFILRKCLGCVGSFILLLVHCLAHIAAGDLSQDSSPAFRRLFYQALKACLGEMFSLRLQTSAVLEDSKSAARIINEAFLKGEEIADEKINLLSDLFGPRMKASEEHSGILLHPDLLESKQPEKKAGCYSCIFSEGQKTSAMSPVAGSCPPSVSEAAEDRLDTLTETQAKDLEKEQHDLLLDEMEIRLEKDSLQEEREQLEGKVPEGRERAE